MSTTPRWRAALRLSIALAILTMHDRICLAQQRTFVAQQTVRGYVAISPDGKMLVAGGSPPEIQAWDIKTGQRLWLSDGPLSGVARLAFSPDGKFIASGSWIRDPRVVSWDATTGKSVTELTGSSTAVCFVAFSPDGKYLAWCRDMDVALWDVKAARQKVVLRSQRGPVDSIAFSPDGKLLAASCGERVVILWDVEGQKVVRQIAANQTDATGTQAVAFSLDGKILATASGTVQLWDVGTGKRLSALGRAGGGCVNAIVFAPDGKAIAAGHNDAVRLWDVTTGKELAKWDSGAGAFSLAVTPDGKALAWYVGDRVTLQPIKP